MHTKRLTDWINLMLSFWLIISPWALTPTASGNWPVLLLGIGVLMVSVWALSRPNAVIPEWWNVTLGVILFFVPWIFNFYHIQALAWNAWFVGVCIVVLAFAGMPMGTHLRHHPHP